jgi:hypothetical protein
MLQIGMSRIPLQMLLTFLNSLNPSSRTLPLRSAQPLTEMSTRNLSETKGRSVHKTDKLTSTFELII